ncbi:MAG: tol-pal system YbgF family protein [Desulfurivibrionaceae bacterium]
MNKKRALGLLLFAVMLLTACSAGLIQRAESKYLARDYRAAADLLELYLDEHPDADLARRKLAHSLFENGRYREAAGQFEKVIGNRPRDTFSHLYLGLAYLRLGDYRKTLAGWRRLEVAERPLIAEMKSSQISKIAAKAPEIASEDQLNDLADQVESAVEEAFFAEQQRDAYNASRLGDCG